MATSKVNRKLTQPSKRRRLEDFHNGLPNGLVRMQNQTTIIVEKLLRFELDRIDEIISRLSSSRDIYNS